MYPHLTCTCTSCPTDTSKRESDRPSWNAKTLFSSYVLFSKSSQDECVACSQNMYRMKKLLPYWVLIISTYPCHTPHQSTSARLLSVVLLSVHRWKCQESDSSGKLSHTDAAICTEGSNTMASFGAVPRNTKMVQKWALAEEHLGIV